MSASAISITLPETVRLFPLPGALLLPNALLPLNVFEPRYLEMTRDAMADDRIIAIIQPKGQAGLDQAAKPELYSVGGLGRIVEFAESPDGRFLIVLQGLLRFRLVEECDVDTPYRQAKISFDGYLGDVRDPPPLREGLRGEMEEALRGYLDAQGLSADWDAVAQADDDGLVRTLAGVCPFDPIEKQALLEAPDLLARAEMLVALMRFAPAAAEATPSRLQ